LDFDVWLFIYSNEKELRVQMYMVIDRKTGDKIGKGSYQSIKRARNKRDKLDNEYGGYRYFVREIETQMNVY
jgi:hypothetical protein